MGPKGDPASVTDLVPSGKVRTRSLRARRLLAAGRTSIAIPADGVMVGDLHLVPFRRGPLRKLGRGLMRVMTAQLLSGLAASIVFSLTLAPNLVALVAQVTFVASLLFGPMSSTTRTLPHLLHRYRLWRADKRFVATPVEHDPRAANPGWIHVRGHVAPGGLTFTSVGGRKDCVLAHYLGFFSRLGQVDQSLAAQAEVHVTDFALAVSANELVQIDTRHARLLATPVVNDAELNERRPLGVRPLGGWPGDTGQDVASVHHEEVLAVGDEVEVLGRLEKRVDPNAASGGYRNPGLRLVLRGEIDRPLEIKIVPKPLTPVLALPPNEATAALGALGVLDLLD